MYNLSIKIISYTRAFYFFRTSPNANRCAKTQQTLPELFYEDNQTRTQTAVPFYPVKRNNNVRTFHNLVFPVAAHAASRIVLPSRITLFFNNFYIFQSPIRFFYTRTSKFWPSLVVLTVFLHNLSLDCS